MLAVAKDGASVGFVLWVVVWGCHEPDVTSALASLRLLSSVCWSRVFVPPTFHSCSLLAAGLLRVEHQSPFVSLGNAALATYPNNLSRKSSRVVGRASSTHVPVLYTNTVQSRMWPWSYSVVVLGGWRNRPLLSPIAHGHHRLVLAYALNDGNTDGQ